MAEAPVSFGVGGGMNNAADPSELPDGQLTEAIGLVYTRGGDQANKKIGRTAFDAASTITNSGVALGGVDYAEFSAVGATNKLVARAGTSFYTADAGLTGTFSATRTGMTDSPTSLWSAFSNERYHYNDGVSTPWTYWYNGSGDTPGFVQRATGMQPVQFIPTVSVQTGSGGGTSVTLTASTVSTSGDKNFQNSNLFVDGDTATCATVSIGDTGVNARILAGTFTGTGSGSRSDWMIQVTVEASVENDGRCTTKIEYTTNFTAGSPTWTQMELTSDAQGKHVASQSLVGTAYDSANIGVRVTQTKKNSKGKTFCNAYDARLTNGVGAGSYATTSGVKYWITERVSSEGIESKSGAQYASVSTGIFTAASGTLVSLPTALTNSNADQFGIYRTADGGAYPTGTLVTYLSATGALGTSYKDTTDPATAAGVITYGILTVAGIPYERDEPPPISTVMATFQNMIVVAPVDKPNILRYSAPGYPESFPLCNYIRMASDRDDNVQGLAVLGARLGVFMKSRCKRIDHLPTATDPDFAVAPEDFAPDHGLVSKQGIAYADFQDGNAQQVIYIARDGLRRTNIYSSVRLTDVINWRATIDVTRLSECVLRNISSESRLEFYFVPAAAFMTALGFTYPANTARMGMFVSYANPGRLAISFTPVQYHSVTNVPISGRDYSFILSNPGPNNAGGIIVVDEVGSTDVTYAYDASGTVPRRAQGGQFYGSESEMSRTRVNRIAVSHMSGSGTATLTLISGNDIDSDSWTSQPVTFSHSNGSKPARINQSGQWHQWRYTHDSTDATPQPLSSISAEIEMLGPIV